MAPRVVDPRRFLLLGSFTDWAAVARNRADEQPVDPVQIAHERGLDRPALIQLRWLLRPEMGLPSAPFTVWRRRTADDKGGGIGFDTRSILGLTVVTLSPSCVFVAVHLTGPGGMVWSFSGMPWSSIMLTPAVASAGDTVLRLSGTKIQTIVVPAGSAVLDITGITEDTVDDPAWERVEIVGLPDDGTLSGAQRLDEPQGMISALGDPVTAARDRFRRGAPFYGWDASVTPGAVAPVWTLADDVTMIKVFDATMLPPIKDMVTTLPVEQQHAFTVNHSLAAPNGQIASTDFSPLRALFYGVATDPLTSLVTGYGTAYELDLGQLDVPGVAAFVEQPEFAFDYMVTADYDKGAMGSGTPEQYAALLINPRGVLPPPAPTNLDVLNDGLQSPATTDAPWRTVNRVSWARVADELPFQIGSYAFGRQQLVPALQPVEPLLDPRINDTALQPIAATIGADPSIKRMAAIDDRYEITAVPNPNPLKYAVVMQDLFGLWSRWSTVNASVGEPAVGPATIITALMDTSTAAAVCPASLTIDLTWNWANRSPQTVEIFGRRFVQAKPADRPADLSVPSTVLTSLTSGAGEVATVVFGPGGSATAFGGAGLTATLSYLALDGMTSMMAPTTNNGPRRYRVTLSGFGLDFSAAPMFGVALWARGTEAKAPQRVGAWSAEPIVTSASDPRPPVITVEHEDVLLASLGDAAGEHHAVLPWPAAPGSIGYFVYTVAESAFRAHHGLPDAAPSLNLSQRLAALRARFETSPDRRPFTRLNAQAFAGTNMPITLPRGTKEIHLYVVLGVSAGQVESAWPTLADPLRRKRPIAYAAPQVVCPSPPALEVGRVLDHSAIPPAYRASVRMSSQAGATVGRVDLHRVRVPDAAVNLFTMGPPVAQVSGSGGPWTVAARTSTERGESQAIGTISGLDPVAGSWKPVYYRAVAWGTDNPTRGQYGGRSEPSAPRSVVVPPADPPVLSAPTYVLPWVASADTRIDLSMEAPVVPTALGPHRIDVEVITEHVDGTTTTALAYPPPVTPPVVDRDVLDLLGMSGPAAGDSGVWRDAPVSGVTQLQVLVRRPVFADGLRARLRITDPLGRVTEQVLVVPPPNPVIPPDGTDATIARRHDGRP